VEVAWPLKQTKKQAGEKINWKFLCLKHVVSAERQRRQQQVRG